MSESGKNRVVFTQQEYSKLMTTLGEISSDIKAMHRRQDITNGRIAVNESRIIALEKSDIEIDGKVQRFIDSVAQYKIAYDKQEEEEKENKRFWSRKIAERALWFVLFIVGIVLTKLGIINIDVL